MAEKSVVGNRIRGTEYELAMNTLEGKEEDAGKIIALAIELMAKRGYVIKPGGKSTTANGGVVYNDLNHLEVCTPSFTSPFEAVAYDKASEIYAYIASVLASKGTGRDVLVYKTNTDAHYGLFGSSSAAYATHSSVCIKRPRMHDWEGVKRSLLPFLVSRIVFTGKGDIVGRSFVISPRALFVETESSEDTMKFRGILNERNRKEWLVDEKGKMEYGWSRNYCNPQKYMRWHDIHYEGLRCDWNIFVRDVFESYIASAFEEGLLGDAPVIHRPVEQFKKLSRDIKGGWKLDGEINGESRKLDVVDDILGYYHERIHMLFDSREKSRLDEISLRNIDLLMDRFRARDLEKFKDYGIDWLTTMDYLKEYGYSMDDLLDIRSRKKAEEAKRVCNAFSLIDSKVLHYLPEGNRGSDAGKESDCLFDPEASIRFFGMGMDEMRKLVDNSIKRPPEATRDWFSWSAIRKFGSHVSARRWDGILLANGKQLVLREPFMLNREEIGDLEGIATVGELVEMARRRYPDSVKD